MSRRIYDWEDEEEQQEQFEDEKRDLDESARRRHLIWPALRHIPTLKGSWRILVLAGVLLLVTGTVLGLANAAADWSAFFCGLSDLLRRGLSLLGAWSRMPLAEPVLAGLVILVPVGLIRSLLRGPRTLIRFLAKLICAACGALLAFVLIYGVCYTAPDLAPELGYTVREYSVDELEFAVNKAVNILNTYASDPDRDSAGVLRDPDFEAVARDVMAAYEKLALRYPRFSHTAGVAPKQTRFIGELMSYLDLAGFFFPWTGECVVSGNVYPSDVAFDTAHEAAHAMGIGPEDACNFAAFLCLMEQEDPALRYSAGVHAYIYLANALYGQDYQAWSRAVSRLETVPRQDMRLRNQHLAQYDGPANDLGNAVNDTYIKVTGQPDGVRSYGKVADLLIAYFLEQ
jgi:hypothetical protein